MVIVILMHQESPQESMLTRWVFEADLNQQDWVYSIQLGKFLVIRKCQRNLVYNLESLAKKLLSKVSVMSVIGQLNFSLKLALLLSELLNKMVASTM